LLNEFREGQLLTGMNRPNRGTYCFWVWRPFWVAYFNSPNLFFVDIEATRPCFVVAVKLLTIDKSAFVLNICDL